jgi:hypothetical protein
MDFNFYQNMSRNESISQITGTNIQMFSDRALKFVLRALSLSRPGVNYITPDYCFEFLNKFFEWNREIDLESFHRCLQDQMLKIHRNLRFG